MANATWVCFACRVTARRPYQPPTMVVCPLCGVACRCVGHQLRVPPRNDAKGWATLQRDLREARRATLEQAVIRHRRRQHRLEQQILALERQPPNEGRQQTLRSLRQKLAVL